ncbi:MAG: ABC transporter ATP-binding protein [Spirochaetales bacterium]|jgi:oligopeptide transport system ATP-binding protein|nr:ABC transporter ATP-binding protein [Spirochaetales bacterium]
MADDVILEVNNLKTYFNTDDGIVKAVDGVSFDLRKGETLGMVGESGSGKSVTNLSLMQLIPSPPGKIISGTALLNGEDILKKNEKQMREIRGNRISMIFQDPMTSLNPFLKISTQLEETITLHKKAGKKEAREKAVEMLDMVGIPDPQRKVDNYPHQFSGGMRQRVMIAMALSCDPEILLADEPSTALDVTIQAQILELIKNLGRRLGTAVVLITHDLGVVAGNSDRIVVMYAGRLVEKGNSSDVFENPLHPYTQGLIKSVPRLDQPGKNRLYSIPGVPPNLINLPECCPFYPRCGQAREICKTAYPPLVSIDNRDVCCVLYGEASHDQP